MTDGPTDYGASWDGRDDAADGALPDPSFAGLVDHQLIESSLVYRIAIGLIVLTANRWSSGWPREASESRRSGF